MYISHQTSTAFLADWFCLFNFKSTYSSLLDHPCCVTCAVSCLFSYDLTLISLFFFAENFCEWRNTLPEKLEVFLKCSKKTKIYDLSICFNLNFLKYFCQKNFEHISTVSGSSDRSSGPQNSLSLHNRNHVTFSDSLAGQCWMTLIFQSALISFLLWRATETLYGRSVYEERGRVQVMRLIRWLIDVSRQRNEKERRKPDGERCHSIQFNCKIYFCFCEMNVQVSWQLRDFSFYCILEHS